MSRSGFWRLLWNGGFSKSLISSPIHGEAHRVPLLLYHCAGPYTLTVLWDGFFSKPDVKTPHKLIHSFCWNPVYNLNSTIFISVHVTRIKWKWNNCVPGIQVFFHLLAKFQSFHIYCLIFRSIMFYGLLNLVYLNATLDFSNIWDSENCA